MSKEQLDSTTKLRAVQSILEGGVSVQSVAKVCKVNQATVYRWIERYEDSGTIERSHNPSVGRPSKVSQVDAEKIIEAISRPASEYGYESDFWTTPRLVQVAKRYFDLKISRMAVHRILKKFEHSYRKPEKRYYSKNKEKGLEEWKKKTVPKIRQILKQKRAILYFEDESNIRLTPVVAKTWGPVGKKILQKTSGNRGSVSAISAISSSGQLIFNVFDGGKRFNSDDIIHFLSQMLKHHPRRHLVVIMDQATCHKSKKTQAFIASQKRLHVFYLPPKTPEYNPDEQVWDHLKNQELKSHQATTIPQLKKLAKKKLRNMSKNKRQLLGIYRRSEGASFFD